MSENGFIRYQGVEKAFGDKVVLDGANLDVWPGESVVVIGQSGVGKSVLIKCIIGILTPDEGKSYPFGATVVLHASGCPTGSPPRT